MKLLFCLLFLLVSIAGVFPQECVTYDFEENFDVLFDNERSVCADQQEWTIGYYYEIDVEPPHNNSFAFISPSQTPSCVTSFPFSLNSAGSLEVNVIMESASAGDNIVILVQSELEGTMLGQGQLVSTEEDFSTGGVQAIDINLFFTGTQEAYIVLLGSASEASAVLVDSFRYTPPGTDAESCQVYDDAEVTDMPDETTESRTTDTTDPTNTGTTETEPEETTTGSSLTETTDAETVTDPTFTGTTDFVTVTDPTFTGTTDFETVTDPTFTGTTDFVTVTDPTFTGTTDFETVTDPTFTGTTGFETVTDPTFTGTTDFVTVTDPTFTGTTDFETVTDPTFTGTTDFVTVTDPTFTGTTDFETVTDPTFNGTTDFETVTDPTFTGTTELETVTDPTFTGTTDFETEVVTTESSFTGTTDLDTEESTGGEDDTTLIPPAPEEVISPPQRSFWNALTIAVVTILCLIVLSLICWYFYEFGRRNSRDDCTPFVVYEDFEDLPKTLTVPRVNKVYSDSVYGINKDKYFV